MESGGVVYFIYMRITFLERTIRVIFGLLCFAAAAYVFTTPTARVVAVAVGGYLVIVEGVLGQCLMYRAVGLRLGKDVLPKEVLYVFGLLGVQAVIAYEWLIAGWEKIQSPEFVTGMAETVTRFSSKNPLPWVQQFLTETVVPNAALFGELVRWGEFLVGAGLFLSMLIFLFVPHQLLKRVSVLGMIFSLKMGSLLSAVFYLSAGWTSPSTHGLNLVMFWVQIALIWAWWYHFWTVPTHQQLLVRRS